MESNYSLWHNIRLNMPKGTDWNWYEHSHVWLGNTLWWTTWSCHNHFSWKYNSWELMMIKVKEFNRFLFLTFGYDLMCGILQFHYCIFVYCSTYLPSPAATRTCIKYIVSWTDTSWNGLCIFLIAMTGTHVAIGKFVDCRVVPFCFMRIMMCSLKSNILCSDWIFQLRT
jgi:hypothetical protein